MSIDHNNRLYMLLELDRIKQASIPHTYAFPMNALELSCIVFKGRSHVLFKMSKARAEDEWNVEGLEHDMFERTPLTSKDAHKVLKSVSESLKQPSYIDQTINQDKFKEPSAFHLNGINNRARNIQAVFSFIQDKCAKSNHQ
ncbi:hypothetical protein CWI42_070220 [Ordospora colligata]|uniref:Uncharacterized protein n=1 Tax=Ordospora colligata OC4 TaxID=1354746 RepID=A0A0B2UED5_9MICR|nr:uncharacterized protein M896_070220 [Ordospora colligata OC4]KHN69456.1 hypothetical protein M896_070220 [Ordospora colligata OC4]TBU15200.1 hypothetical protein CWI41_070220 [Ordospora colligata]TBU15271.1 hypothetical protein CWI40_070220 [Ordospora colligata]TBU18453.1 hypothetical protein CWI42_070220 [Ordospora colligata]